jgi:hypothetical protein
VQTPGAHVRGGFGGCGVAGCPGFGCRRRPVISMRPAPGRGRRRAPPIAAGRVAGSRLRPAGSGGERRRGGG